MVSPFYRQILVLSLPLLAGCGSSYYAAEDERLPSQSPDTDLFVSGAIASQLDKIQADVKNFSNFFLFQDKDIKLPRREVLASEQYVLNRSVFIDWSGPVSQLLDDLAGLTGYRVQTIGSRPIIPPIVTLSHQKIKLLDVIRDVALQIHQKADLVVFPDEQLIELRYR